MEKDTTGLGFIRKAWKRTRTGGNMILPGIFGRRCAPFLVGSYLPPGASRSVEMVMYALERRRSTISARFGSMIRQVIRGRRNNRITVPGDRSKRRIVPGLGVR